MDGLLFSLEKARVHYLRDREYTKLSMFDGYYLESKEPTAPLVVNGYKVFQIQYDGSMPSYKAKDIEYQKLIRNYYFKATVNQLRVDREINYFKKAAIVIEHYFNDSIIRDLDNRNKKYIIDALRHCGLLKNDDYRNVAYVENGHYTDELPYVNVFILEWDNISDFLKVIPSLKGRSNLINELLPAVLIPKVSDDKEINKMSGKRNKMDYYWCA